MKNIFYSFVEIGVRCCGVSLHDRSNTAVLSVTGLQAKRMVFTGVESTDRNFVDVGTWRGWFITTGKQIVFLFTESRKRGFEIEKKAVVTYIAVFARSPLQKYQSRLFHCDDSRASELDT